VKRRLINSGDHAVMTPTHTVSTNGHERKEKLFSLHVPALTSFLA
jgi:hypothetical protein